LKVRWGRRASQPRCVCGRSGGCGRCNLGAPRPVPTATEMGPATDPTHWHRIGVHIGQPAACAEALRPAPRPLGPGGRGSLGQLTNHPKRRHATAAPAAAAAGALRQPLSAVGTEARPGCWRAGHATTNLVRSLRRTPIHGRNPPTLRRIRRMPQPKAC
jgi:hypothetical protein